MVHKRWSTTVTAFAASVLAVLTLALSTGGGAHAGNLAPGRDRLPVVLKGERLGSWVGTKNLNHIYLYRYESGANPPWIPIPFQIDKRRKANVLHFVGDRAEVEAAFNDLSDVCVLSYFPPDSSDCATWIDDDPINNPLPAVRECPITYQGSFQTPILAATDEIVFMARDMQDGEQDPCPYSWPADDPLNPGSLQNERIALVINDDANGNGTIESAEVSWVYAYLWTSPPPDPADKTPPDYTYGACDPGCSGENEGNNVHNVDCGIVHSNPPSGLEGLQIHMNSNWVVDDLSVIDGGSTKPDILEILGYRAAITEMNMNWDCVLAPRELDVIDPAPGQVRFVRGVQGAQSGPATRKYDKVYDTYYEIEVELRVHPIEDLELKQGHNTEVSGHQDGAAVWAKTPTEADEARYDVIDGSAPTGSTNPKNDDWWQVMVEAMGGTATYFYPDRARGELPAMSKGFFYQDASPTFGNFGRTWATLSNMQDGEVEGISINDGGCGPTNEPESPALLFKRLRQAFIPLKPDDELNKDSVLADDWEFSAENPIEFGTRRVEGKNDQCPGGGPPPLCTPTLDAQLDPDGSVDLSASLSSTGGCDAGASTLGFTSQVGSGAEAIIGYADASGVLRHATTKLGLQHSYRAFALAGDGRISGKSAPVTLTPADTDPPLPPAINAVTPIQNGATVDFRAVQSPGTHLVNFYASTTSGGPYTQVNPQSVYVTTKQYTVAGLDNDTTYYIVLTAVDSAGNESAYSTEYAVTPGS